MRPWQRFRDHDLHYLKLVWQRQLPSCQKALRRGLALVAALWLAGAVYAADGVAGFAPFPTAVRMGLGLLMGPAGLFWGLLKATGLLADSARDPNMAWLLLVWLPAGVALLVLKLNAHFAATLVQVEVRNGFRPGYRFRPRRKRKSKKRRKS